MEAGSVWTVSIHAPARGATPCFPTKPGLAVCFNPRPREGGDFVGFKDSGSCLGFQSTPPRGGRQNGLLKERRKQKVSIHAPARGATGGHWVLLEDVQVSIHAPARGATRRLPRKDSRSIEFQSTPPRGGRRLNASTICPASWFQSTPPRGGRPPSHPHKPPRLRVSIHAPARGATVMRFSLCVARF